jgi:hypothetical protein
LRRSTSPDLQPGFTRNQLAFKLARAYARRGMRETRSCGG